MLSFDHCVLGHQVLVDGGVGADLRGPLVEGDALLVNPLLHDWGLDAIGVGFVGGVCEVPAESLMLDNCRVLGGYPDEGRGGDDASQGHPCD